MQGPTDRIRSQNAAGERMRNNKVVQYISARHQRLYNKWEKANMTHDIYAGAVPGNDESEGFIQSYSKETLFCPGMSPYRTRHVKDSKSSVTLHQSRQRILHYTAKHWVKDIWDWTRDVLLLLRLITVRDAQPEDLAKKKIKYLDNILYRSKEINLNDEVTSLFSYIDLHILSKFHYQNSFWVFFLFCFVDRASRYIRVMKTNLMHYLSSVYFVSQPPHVSGIFVAHHREVYCIYTIIGTYCYF
jgi:hypothetical protein